MLGNCIYCKILIFLFYFTVVLYQIFISYTNNLHTGLVDRVFANGPGDLGSIPGHDIPKTFKMVLGTSFLNT